MIRFDKKYIPSIGLQVFSAILMVTQACIFPKILGAVEYGKGVYLVSTALVLHGLLEPLCQAVLISKGQNNLKFKNISESQFVIDCLTVVPIGWFIVLMLYSKSIELWKTLILFLHLLLCLISIISQSYAFAKSLFGRVFYAVATGYVIYIIIFWLTHRFGAISIILGQLGFYLSLIVICGLDEVPKFGRICLKFTGNSNIFNRARMYLEVTSTRLGYVFLNSGLILLIGTFRNYIGIAHYKVCVSMMNGGRYASPINNALFQYVLSERKESIVRKRTSEYLVLMFSIWMIVGFILFLAGNRLLSFIFSGDQLHLDTSIFFLTPAYLLLQPLGLTRLFLADSKLVVIINLLGVLCACFIAIFFGMWSAFKICVVGMAFFLTVAVIHSLKSLRPV